MSDHSLLQGIFPIQESNPGLLHCRQILYHLSHQGSPCIYIYMCVCVCVCARACVHAYVCVCEHIYFQRGEHFPGGSAVKNLPTNAGDVGSVSGWGRSPGEGNGNPLQHSCLRNPMNRGAWRATVHGVARVRHNLTTKQ